MVDSRSTQSKRSTHSSTAATKGVTLVELLVGMFIAGLIVTVALALTISSRDVYRHDQIRTSLNQNMRSGLDLIGADIRQAGENLPDSFPAILVSSGGTGPDTLTVRFGMVAMSLPLCDSVSGTHLHFHVATTSSNPPAGCDAQADTTGDGFPDNISMWRNYREGQKAKGANALGYIYNRTTRVGEFFIYEAEARDGQDFRISRPSSSSALHHSYNTNTSVIYLLEERRYELSGDLLRVIENGRVADPKGIIDRVTNFKINLTLGNGTTVTSFGVNDGWININSVNLTLEGNAQIQGKTISRNVTDRFLPRNVLSHARSNP